MPTLKIWFQLLAISGVIILGLGCEDKENMSPDPNIVSQEVSSIMTSTSWIITKYMEKEIDKTQDYSNMSFEFNANEVLTVSKNTDQFTGMWSISYKSDDDSQDDNPHSEYDDIDFNIHFTSPDKLAELSEDWEIISYSDSIIELIHISGGDGDVSYLTFEKL